VLFWVPFIPFYARELGAASDAEAIFWVAIATGALGVGRLVSGPVWGVLADRYGRKPMFLRALVFASLTMLIAGLAQAPWHLSVAFISQGLFSGFIPAAVALTSVSSSETNMSRSLSLVTGAQHLGNTIGPSIGAFVALSFGYRGAIFAGATLPMFAAVLVLLFVPRDQVVARVNRRDAGAPARRGVWRSFERQFYIAVFVYFALFAIDQLIRLSAPITLQRLEGRTDVAGLTGLAFTVAGVAAVAGVLVIGQRIVRVGRLRATVVVGVALTALVFIGLALTTEAYVFIGAFAALALLQATMVPATNAIIAANVPREHRGTAFGVAGSAQAVAFLCGPMAAAAFAATSLSIGYGLLGVLLLGFGGLLLVTLREPPRAEGAAG